MILKERNKVWQPEKVLSRWRKFLPVINFSLTGAVFFLIGLSGYYYFSPQGYDFETISHSVPGEMGSFPELTFKLEDPVNFLDVSARNMFSSERQEWETKKKEKEKKREKKSILDPMIKKLTLYGVAGVGGVKKALVSDIEGKKKGSRYKYVTEGDMILGCLIKKIEKDRIILFWQGEEIVKTVQNREYPATQIKRQGKDKTESKADAALKMQQVVKPKKQKNLNKAG